MAYLYTDNVSPQDRFERFTLQLDNGQSAILRKGSAYNLSATELARARMYIVLVSTSDPVADLERITSLPIIGSLTDGDVPVWDSALGAFVPGSGGGGGGGVDGMPSCLYSGSAYPERPADATSVMWIGPVPPTIGGAGNAVNGADVWVDTS